MKLRATKDFSLPDGVTFRKGAEFYAYEYDYHDPVNCRSLENGNFYDIDKKILSEMEVVEQ